MTGDCGVGGGEVVLGVLLQVGHGVDGGPLASPPSHVPHPEDAVLVVGVLEPDLALLHLAVLGQVDPRLPGSLGQLAPGLSQHIVDGDVDVLVEVGLSVRLLASPQPLLQDGPVGVRPPVPDPQDIGGGLLVLLPPVSFISYIR